MKIAVHGVDFSSPTGPNAFCRRMLRRLRDCGHQLVVAGSDCDVDFVNVTLSAPARSGRIVQRLDGIWTAVHQLHMNTEIKRAYDQATLVVWQSEYDKKLITRAFGQKSGYVIRNGAERPSREALDIAKQIKLQTRHKIACCSASWHPQKRLTDNVSIMRQLAQASGDKFTMLVLGRPDDSVAADDVHVIGQASELVCQAVYAASDVLIHAAWRDHCPNAVCEALAAGCPVICTDSGGTSETMCEHVTVIRDVADHHIDDVIFDHDKPPKLIIDSRLSPPAGRCACAVHTVERAAKEYEAALFAALVR